MRTSHGMARAVHVHRKVVYHCSKLPLQHLQDEIEKRKQRQAELEDRERQLKDVRAKQAELQDKQKVSIIYLLLSMY